MMLSNKPYLLRAFHEWIIDSGFNPILIVNANDPKAKIPRDFAEGSEIVFSISPSAVRDLKMTNDIVEFKATFSGVVHIISVPMRAILAIQAEENGEGISFEPEDDVNDFVQKDESRFRSINNVAEKDSLEQRIEAAVTATEKGKPFLTLVE